MSEARSADDLYRDPLDKDELPPFLDPVTKTNDPKRLREKALSDKQKELKQEADLREVLSTEGGVRFVARILTEFCVIDAPAFHPNNSTMCNIAGRRQVGQQIKELIRNAEFDLWVKVDRQIERERPKPKSSERNR